MYDIDNMDFKDFIDYMTFMDYHSLHGLKNLLESQPPGLQDLFPMLKSEGWR